MTVLQGNSDIAVFQTSTEAAQAAANAVAGEIRRLLAAHGRATTIFDGFIQQIAFFDALVRMPGIDWTQVIVFQAGEYLGVDQGSPESAQRFLTDHLVLRVPIVSFHAMRGDAANQHAAAANFSARLATAPPDFAFLGFDLLTTEPEVPSDEAVTVMSICQRRSVAITPVTIGRLPKLFALGHGPAPMAARRHPNAEIFIAVNP